MKKHLVTVLALAQAGAVFAQGTTATLPAQTSTVESKSFYQTLKDSPFDLGINLETDTARNDDNQIKGYEQVNTLTGTYKASANDKFNFVMKTVHDKMPNLPTDNSVNRLVAKYTRGNLLTEANNGVSLKASAEYRYLPDTAVRNEKNRYSHLRVGPTLAKSFGMMTADVGVFYALDQVRDKSAKNYEESNWYIPTSQSFDFTDKLKLVMLEEFVSQTKKTGKGEAKTLDLTAEVGYQFTPEFYMGVSAAGQPVKEVDGKKALNQYSWEKRLTYGVNFDLAVF